MLKRFFLLIILLSFSSLNNVFAQDGIAFIDLNYLFNNSLAGKKINEQIQKKTKTLNSEVTAFREKISKEKEKLITQKNVISRDEYNKKLAVLEKDVQNFNENINKKQRDLMTFKNNARNEFSKKLKIILEEFSSKNSIAMILRKENLLIGKKSLDVTKNILELFDKNVKKITIQ